MSSEYFEAQAADVMATAGGDPANAGQLAAWAEDGAIRQQIGQPIIHVPAWQVCTGRSRGVVSAGVPRRQKTGA